MHTLGVSLQVHRPSRLGRWVYGAEYYRDWVDSSYRGYDPAGNLTQVRVQGPVADDANYDLLGLYVEDPVPLMLEYERFAAEAACFYTFMDDLIVRVPTGATASNGDLIVNEKNSGEGYVHGVELAGSLKLHRDWTLWANFSSANEPRRDLLLTAELRF